MTIRDARDLKAETNARGLHRTLVVTALGLEMDAVRAYLTEPCSVNAVLITRNAGDIDLLLQMRPSVQVCLYDCRSVRDARSAFPDNADPTRS